MTAPASPTTLSYASWPRRIVALFVDWIVSTLVTVGVMGSRYHAGTIWVMVVFLIEVAVLTALVGGSFGQLLAGIRVLTLDGRPVNLLLSTVRTLLICLVIPPLVFRRDSGRGLHDLAVGSAAYAAR